MSELFSLIEQTKEFLKENYPLGGSMITQAQNLPFFSFIPKPSPPSQPPSQPVLQPKPAPTKRNPQVTFTPKTHSSLTPRPSVEKKEPEEEIFEPSKNFSPIEAFMKKRSLSSQSPSTSARVEAIMILSSHTEDEIPFLSPLLEGISLFDQGGYFLLSNDLTPLLETVPHTLLIDNDSWNHLEPWFQKNQEKLSSCKKVLIPLTDALKNPKLKPQLWRTLVQGILS